jgi:hypothetical protein
MEISCDSLPTAKARLRKNMELIKLRLGDRVQFTTNQNFNLSLSNQSKPKPTIICKNHSVDRFPLEEKSKYEQNHTNREQPQNIFSEKKNNIFKVRSKREGSKESAEKIGD